MKPELFELAMYTLQPLLGVMFTEDGSAKVAKELSECLSYPDSILGIFPVGGKWGEESAINLRFRPGIAAWRANALIIEALGHLLL